MMQQLVTSYRVCQMMLSSLLPWPNGGLFKNWEYVVLSRVRTRDGLYLFQPIDMNKSFNPSEELTLFLKQAKQKEAAFLRQRKHALRKL